MRVVGADLSITSTALALLDSGELAQLFNFKTKGRKGATYDEWCERIELVSREVLQRLTEWHLVGGIDLLVIEAPSHGSKFGNPHERAGLWWDVYRWAYAREIPVVTVTPKTRQKYITGNGGTGITKADVLAAARETYAVEIRNDDEADALGLGDMGARHLGEPLVPSLPAKHLEAWEVPAWPAAA